MSHIIETKNLTKKFGNLTAVDGISFSVDKGEIFGLLGPNGAGKSTTISMLCTILKVTSGTAIVNGFDVTKNPSEVRKSIGIVFQDPSIDDKLTGRENLQMHANLYSVPTGIQKERINEVLEARRARGPGGRLHEHVFQRHAAQARDRPQPYSLS